jgi:ELWxxDGT repeat protein
MELRQAQSSCFPFIAQPIFLHWETKRVFIADGGDLLSALWETDGTPAGTKQLIDISTLGIGFLIMEPTVVNGIIFLRSLITIPAISSFGEVMEPKRVLFNWARIIFWLTFPCNLQTIAVNSISLRTMVQAGGFGFRMARTQALCLYLPTRMYSLM